MRFNTVNMYTCLRCCDFRNSSLRMNSQTFIFMKQWDFQWFPESLRVSQP